MSPQKVVFCNLATVILVGTIVCFWFWRNSPWFEEFGAILTFSGVLSWLAAMTKIVPDDKVKEFQGKIYGTVFESSKAIKWNSLALVLVAALSFCFASIQLEPIQESVERAFVVYPARGLAADPRAYNWSKSMRITDGDFDTLQPGKRARKVVSVWWGLKRDFVVKVSGYPDKVIKLYPWQRLGLVVPSSFRRPVALLRPTARLMNNARMHPWTLIVRRESTGEELQMPFDGHAVWLGCDGNVQVPLALQNMWGESEVNPILKPFWTQPKAFTNGLYDLKQGEKLFVQMKSIAAAEPGISREIESPSGYGDFAPQIIDIDSAN